MEEFSSPCGTADTNGESLCESGSAPEGQSTAPTAAQEQSAETQSTVPSHTANDNARFAAQRRKAEAEKREAELQSKWFNENIGFLQNPKTLKPFESLDEWRQQAIELANSSHESSAPEIEPFEIINAIREDVLANDPRVAYISKLAFELKRKENEGIYDSDLKEIKARYPDEEAEHVKELGINFLKLRESDVPPVIAYEAVRNAAKQRAAAPGMGDIETNSTAAKDYFTKSEVQKMSRSEVKNNYETIRKSMNKW